MRLTCPNCSARYEVDDSLVPPEGRDVQCSNCATTWFQPGNRTQIEEIESDAPEQAAAQPDGPEPDNAEPSGEGSADEGPVRRELDPAIRDLLREEREREETLRHGGVAGSIEAQEEMALNDPETEDSAPDTDQKDADDEADAETLAALRAATAIGTAAAATPSARDLLPDIEEINSTLRATTDRNARELDSSDIETIEAIPRRRRGFRLGFVLVVLLVTLATGAYIYAAEIAEALPQAEPLLDTYVTQVDTFRFWLDDLVQGLAERLNNTASEGE